MADPKQVTYKHEYSHALKEVNIDVEEERRNEGYQKSGFQAGDSKQKFPKHKNKENRRSPNKIPNIATKPDNNLQVSENVHNNLQMNSEIEISHGFIWTGMKPTITIQETASTFEASLQKAEMIEQALIPESMEDDDKMSITPSIGLGELTEGCHFDILHDEEDNSSPRSSHTEDMINKISIYSKVSGCRMSNLSEQVIIKQLRVVILEKLANGAYNQVGLYRFAFEKLKNGGLQVISSDKCLIDAIGTLKYFAGIPVKMTFPDTPRVVGFIRNLPVNIEPSELKDTIRENIPEVYSVRYVTERILGEGLRKSPCAFVSFNLRFLPKTVVLFGKEYELHVPNPMQCSRCCRYGHQGKQCRAQVRCLYCSEAHSKFQCRSVTHICVNCKEAHPANSHDCLVWQQGKMMNELRYRGGYSAENAMSIASNGKIPLKKHNFICVDYFENQDAFFFEGLSDESYGSDELNNVAAGSTEHHPRAMQVQPFLDLLSEFYLRLVNYSYEGPPADLEPIEKRPKEQSVAAIELKKTVLDSMNDEPATTTDATTNVEIN